MPTTILNSQTVLVSWTTTRRDASSKHAPVSSQTTLTDPNPSESLSMCLSVCVCVATYKLNVIPTVFFFFFFSLSLSFLGRTRFWRSHKSTPVVGFNMWMRWLPPLFNKMITFRPDKYFISFLGNGDEREDEKTRRPRDQRAKTERNVKSSSS